MNFLEKLKCQHRFLRYRYRTEKSTIARLLEHNLKGRTVIDVGANKGVFSYWLHRAVGSNGRVIAFEPQPELIPYLHSVKEAFGLTNWTIINKGLSDEETQLKMYRPFAGSGGASVEDYNSDKGFETIHVAVTRLDDYLREENLIDIALMKVDVEGHELPVFKGAAEMLKESKPILIFECHHDKAVDGELFGFLASLGYRGYFIHDNENIEYQKFQEYSYRKPGESHRNYFFVAA